METQQLPLADMFPLLSPNRISINGLLQTVKQKPSDVFIKSDSDRVDQDEYITAICLSTVLKFDSAN